MDQRAVRSSSHAKEKIIGNSPAFPKNSCTYNLRNIDLSHEVTKLSQRSLLR